MFGIVRKKLASIILDVHRLAAMAGLFLAVALAGASVAGSFFVPTKALGVLLSSVGCFAAGWLFSVFLAKTVRLGSKERDAAAALAVQRAENERLQNEMAELRAEKKRLESQRIDINAVRPVLKLGLMEADMSIKDVKIAWQNDFDNGHMIELDALDNGPKRSQYVGVLQRSFKATYGVDLAKLRIREDDDCLRVAGIVPESLGFKNDRTTWLLRQIQTFRLKRFDETSGVPMPVADISTGFKSGDYFYEIDREKPFDGILDLNQTAAASETQEKELRGRINNGIGEEFRNVNGYIRDMAEGFVRILLAPVKKPIVFEPTPLKEIEKESGWLVLEDFAKDYNKRLEAPSPL